MYTIVEFSYIYIIIHIDLFLYTYMVYTGFVFIGLFLSAFLSPFSRQEITRAFPTNPRLPTCRYHGGGDQNAVKVRRWMMFFFPLFFGGSINSEVQPITLEQNPPFR